jgi:uncharacterized membrane protein
MRSAELAAVSTSPAEILAICAEDRGVILAGLFALYSAYYGLGVSDSLDDLIKDVNAVKPTAMVAAILVVLSAIFQLVANYLDNASPR